MLHRWFSILRHEYDKFIIRVFIMATESPDSIYIMQPEVWMINQSAFFCAWILHRRTEYKWTEICARKCLRIIPESFSCPGYVFYKHMSNSYEPFTKLLSCLFKAKRLNTK